MSSKTAAEIDPDAWLEAALARLDEWGLILDSDPKLPSWPSLVVEHQVRGSWWSDPDVQLIDEVGSRLVNHPDVFHVVLVSGKLTCLHRRLWEAFLAVALADEDWKFRGLSAAARTVLELTRAGGRLSADEAGLPSTDAKQNGRLMRELERRLLCAGGSMHTARGAHVKFVIGWETWMAEHDLPAPRLPAESGRRQLDECLAALNRQFDGHGTLPWRAATP